MKLKYRTSEHELGKPSLTTPTFNVLKGENQELHREFGPLKLQIVSDWSFTDASPEIHISNLANHPSGG